MKVVVTGATGFIGQALCKRLWRTSNEVTALTRDIGIAGATLGPLVRCVGWGPKSPPEWKQVVAESDAVIHLAGESLAAHKWTTEVKRKIRLSRVETTRLLVQTICRPGSHCKTLISGSAIGYYGDRGDEELTEASRPGTGFLADVCRQWEEEAHHAAETGVRVVCARMGVVLGDGGALTKILYPSKAPLSPWKLGFGGPVGSGKQWFSWVHRTDATGILAWALESADVSGAVNVTSPNPVRNAEFAASLGHALHRPTLVHVPAFIIRSQLGELAETVLASERVIPQVALEGGYRFRFTSADEALKAILSDDEHN